MGNSADSQSSLGLFLRQQVTDLGVTLLSENEFIKLISQ